MAKKKQKRNDEIKYLRSTKTMTLQEIADAYGISRQRVQQIVGATNFNASPWFHTLKNSEWLRRHRDFTNEEIAEMIDAPVDVVKAHRVGRVYPNNGYKNGEWKVAKKLEAKGHRVDPPKSRDYDLLVDGKIKIDVKISNGNQSKNSNTESLINTYYIFSAGDEEKRRKSDFFICHIPEHNAWFIIPSKEMFGKRYNEIKFVYPHSGLGPKSMWRKYEDRWDLLK